MHNKSAYRFLVENVKERSTLGDLDVDGILKWILKKDGRQGLDSSGSG